MVGQQVLRSAGRRLGPRGLPRPTAAGTFSADLKRTSVGRAGVPPVSPGSLRTAADLPAVSLPTMMYRLTVKGFYNRMHELQLYEKQIYGSLYTLRFGNKPAVALSSAKLVEELLRKETKFPSRGELDLWVEYRDLRGLGYGLITENGEKWYNLRSVLNKRLLRPKDSLKFEHVVNEVVTDFIRRIRHLRAMSSTGDLVPDMSNELYHFSLEGISRILFETRIGCLENEIPTETKEFIGFIHKMIVSFTFINMLPRWTRPYLPLWQRFVDSWDGIFKFTTKLIDQKMENIQKRLDSNQEIEGDFLSYWVSSTSMSKKDVYGSITEVLLAAVDTTSNTLLWTLYLLSQNPEIQDRLYQEVSGIVTGDSIPTAKDVNNMPYLRAVVKETLRVYPTVPLNIRHFSDSDVTIGGHYFPKETMFVIYHYAIGQDETVFPEPQVFRPERWLRDGTDRPHPFGSIPFGFGVRSCVGRRIAELEMHLVLARIMKHFEVKLDPNVGKLKAINRIILVPDRPVNFIFLERKSRAFC